MKIEALDHVALAVSDLAASLAWYTAVLGLEHVYQDEWDGVPTFVVAPGDGRSGLALFPAEVRHARAGPDPENDLAHVAFRVDRANFQAAQARLREHGVPFRFVDHAVSHSIYFRDPDEYRLEITTYEV